jgi:adenylate cyclase
VLELLGDEALAVFGSARQALRAAVDLQARCAQQTEADPALPLRVGMGLDAGAALPVEGGYRGGALNLAARLCSAAGAGEVLLSAGLAQRAGLLEGLAYMDRGRVRLKGLAAPVRVLPLLPTDAVPATAPPPLRGVLPASPLPVPPTPFVGRSALRERSAACSLSFALICS